MDKLKDYIKTLLKLAINNNPEVLNVVRNAKVENDAAFESKHPRKEDGTFTRTNGQSFYNEATKTIELKGDELGSTDEEIRENGLKYFKEKYQGKKFDNPELKGILFSRVGLNKLKSNSADIEKIKAIPALKDIVEKGEYMGSEDLAHPRQDGIIKFHRINHDVSINGQKENMSVLIGEDRDGNRFYNLNNKTYTVENSSRVIRAKGRADEEFSINIITQNAENFNPKPANIKKNEVQNNKEQDMALLDELKKLVSRVENSWDESRHPRDESGRFVEKGSGGNKYYEGVYKDAKIHIRPDGKYADLTVYAPEGRRFRNGDVIYTTETTLEKAEKLGKDIVDDEFKSTNTKGVNNMDDKEKVENEKVDKRKLIDEVAGIMKSAGADDELIRTAIGKMEKIAYDKSEAETADNACDEDKEEEVKNKKVKNEETEKDKEEYEDLKKDVKEDVKNKCKNSVDNSKGGYFDKMNEIYNSAIQPTEENTYISREQKLKDAETYFAK